MSKQTEALKLALEALEAYKGFIDDAHILEGQWHWLDGLDNVQTALQEALAEQETVLPGGGHVPAVPVAVYGYCPECGGAGVMRERRPNGDDKCTNGHKYPSSKALAEQPAQQTCNCRWEGEVQVQQCTLHEAHVDAIHEWAERAKSAEHQFKNFHRLLCERFGYTHDERDWRRDQLSLIEWIAKRAEQPAQQEPVAVVSGYYGGQCVILPIDPARIFNSNTPLYTAPQPCPTCEALARTVMLDQTSHDAQRKPLTMQERTSIVRANKSFHDKNEIDAYGIIDDVEAAHGIGEKK